MNEIAGHLVEREIGIHNVAAINGLKQWLDHGATATAKCSFDDPDSRLLFACKRAPSIITRSECELFGVSLPRFALRINLRADQTEFINARRTVLFADQARSWGKPKKNAQATGVRALKRGEPMPDNRFRLSLRCPGWILHANTCIADSVIQIPERMLDGSHIITAPLWKLYGRTDQGAEYSGTPYIRHIPLSGGGLCAQAVCFMATLLMIEEASAVYGIAEISRLAFGQSDQHLLLTGLKPEHVKNYFTHVNLNLHSQSPPDHESFRFAMKAYLGSNKPIIFPLDAGIMHGKLPTPRNDFISIMESNHVVPRIIDKNKPRPHAIVILGYGEDQFIFHDPSTLPFLTATVNQLWDAGRYTSPEMAKQLSGNFFAVVPSSVNLRIVESGHIEKGEFVFTHLGLVNLAQRVLDLTRENMIQQTRKLCLLSLADAFSEISKVTEWSADQLDTVKREIQQLQKFVNTESWIWLQCLSDRHILIWDATKEPPCRPNCTTDRAREYLLLHLEEDGRLVRLRHSKYPSQQSKGGTSSSEAATEIDHSCAETLHTADQPESYATKSHLKKALLTSFDTNILDGIGRWPEGWPHAEKYMMMQAESERLIKSALKPSLVSTEFLHFFQYTFRAIGHDLYQQYPLLRWFHPNTLRRKRAGYSTRINRMPRFGWIWPGTTALHRLSAIYHKKRAIEKLAANLTGGRQPRIVAFATFFPEVTAPQEKLRKKVAAALKSLCQIAGELNVNYGHAVAIIEVVAGSLVDGIWPGLSEEDDPAEDTEYVANLMSDGEGINRLIEVLNSVAPEAKANNVRLAIELEPGPLYLLRNLPTLELLCSRLEKEPNLKDCVGLNLDIAHWHLAGIKPSEIPEAVLKKIIHCHATDTYKGHCIDLPPGSTNGLRLLSQWLDLLPSGVVTCEMEGCPNEAWLTEASHNLHSVGVRSEADVGFCDL